MPYSSVLYLRPQMDFSISDITGVKIRDMFFNLLERINEEIYNRIRTDRRYKPFTLSNISLVKEGAKSNIVKAGQECFLRITALDDKVFSNFSYYFMTSQPKVKIDNIEFIATKLLFTPDSGNPWSCFLSYPLLLAKTQNNIHKIRLQFFTPTTLHYSYNDMPLPIPTFVFNSWLQKWLTFYKEYNFGDDILKGIDKHVRITYCEIKSEITTGLNIVGFVGNVTYEIDKDASEELVYQLNLLANFSFYSGTGRKTTMGMGQTRRL